MKRIFRKIFLRPGAWLYGAATRARNYLYDNGYLASMSFSIPIISVGNLTVGGNAKTPLTLVLCKEARELGYKPVVVSRGYGGTESGPYLVTDKDPPSRVGDEPRLMADRGEIVVISRSRCSGVSMILQKGLGDLVILDDGLQHRALGRSIDLLAINVGSEEAIAQFERGELLPLGRFREERGAALKRIHGVILASRGGNPAELQGKARLKSLLPNTLAVFEAEVVAGDIVSPDGTLLKPPQEITAFCGIANPQPFFDTMKRLGYVVRATRVFPDHHSFRTLPKAEEGSYLVCTEKDAVKLRERGITNYFYLPIEMKIEGGTILSRYLTKMGEK